VKELKLVIEIEVRDAPAFLPPPICLD